METSEFLHPLSSSAEPNNYLNMWTYDANNIMLSETFKSFDTTSTTVTGGDSTYWYFHKTFNGINDITNSSNMLIYPNPCRGLVTMSLSHPAYIAVSHPIIEVYNVLGEKVNFAMLKQVQHDYEINLSSQPNGIYFYRVIKETGELLGEGKIILAH